MGSKSSQADREEVIFNASQPDGDNQQLRKKGHNQISPPAQDSPGGQPSAFVSNGTQRWNNHFELIEKCLQASRGGGGIRDASKPPRVEEREKR